MRMHSESPIQMLLLVVDFLELGIDDVSIGGTSRFCITLLLGLLHRLSQLLGGLAEFFHAGVNCIFVIALDGFFCSLGRLFDLGFFVSGNLRAMFLEQLFDGMDHGVTLVPGFDEFERLTVLGGMRHGIFRNEIRSDIPAPDIFFEGGPHILPDRFRPIHFGKKASFYPIIRVFGRLDICLAEVFSLKPKHVDDAECHREPYAEDP